MIERAGSCGDRVRFVSYTGRYPNLCSGVLTLEIDGQEAKFGHDLGTYNWKLNRYEDTNYDRFWRSGGGVDERYVPFEDEWVIMEDALPEKFRPYIDEIDRVFNYNVEHGCCGGCV